MFCRKDDTHLTLCIRPISWPVSLVWRSWLASTMTRFCRCGHYRYCCQSGWPWSAAPRWTCPRPWPVIHISAGTPWLCRWSNRNPAAPRTRLRYRVLRARWRHTKYNHNNYKLITVTVGVEYIENLRKSIFLM